MTVVGGALRAGVDIGDVSQPDFCRLPDPAMLFAGRASRFAALAAEHAMAPYLGFLATVAKAQQAALSRPPGFLLPDSTRLALCREHGMPPLRPLSVDASGWRGTLDVLLGQLATAEMPELAREAADRLRDAHDSSLAELAEAFLGNEIPADAMGETVLVGAALQVELAKLASLLDPGALVPVGDGLCPACGGLPVSGMVVGWPRAHGSRYLCCATCAVAWSYVRIKCAFCASTKGIAYHGIADHASAVKAETCDECKGYLKLIRQDLDPLADPVADDVASLALDLLVREAGWQRRAVNVYLVGS